MAFLNLNYLIITMKESTKNLGRSRSKKWLFSTLSLLVLLLSGTSLLSQTITGNVSDGGGSPLIGATVLESNSENGTVTDLDGNFTLDLSGVSTQLTISYIGYQTLAVEAVAGDPMSITLYEGVGLDEVVIGALGISREKKSLGYAVTELGGSELSLVKESNVASSLAGKVAGLVYIKILQELVVQQE